MPKLVEFWDPRGPNYVLKELRKSKIPNKIQKIILRKLEILERYGVEQFNKAKEVLDIKFLKGSQLKEIRIQQGRVIFVVKNNKIWLLHFFIKKTNRTPLREIETAENRLQALDLYLNK